MGCAPIAVLAGGRGSRLGGAKPRARLGGRPLISFPVAAAIASGHETVVIAKRHSPLPPLDCPVAYEPAIPQHPLCGIVTALRHAAGAPVVVVGCDMPFLTPRLLAWLAEAGRPVIGSAHASSIGQIATGSVAVAVDGRIQPLLARYARRDLPVLERALSEQASLRRAVQALRPEPIAERELRPFGEPRTLCFNVNEPADLAYAEGLLARNSSLAVRSSANETATSSADSASAPEKSVAKRP